MAPIRKTAAKKTATPAKKTALKKSASADPAKLAAYERLVATLPGVDRKGDANPYTAINGNMFSLLLAGQTLGLRLPADAHAAFTKKYKPAPFETYGMVMKEYVSIPDDLLLKAPKALQSYFAQSFAYAQTLKPKPTTRAKK